MSCFVILLDEDDDLIVKIGSDRSFLSHTLTDPMSEDVANFVPSLLLETDIIFPR